MCMSKVSLEKQIVISIWVRDIPQAQGIARHMVRLKHLANKNMLIMAHQMENSICAEHYLHRTPFLPPPRWAVG